MIDINRIIENLKQTNPNGFVSKEHFQVEFANALIRVLPEYKLTLNHYFEHVHTSVDLIARGNNEVVGFNFRYYTRKDIISLNNGITAMIKNTGPISNARIDFWKDVSKLERLSMFHCFDYGFNILLTNDTRMFEPIKATNRCDREFDLSGGLRPMLHNLHRYDRNGNPDNYYRILAYIVHSLL